MTRNENQKDFEFQDFLLPPVIIEDVRVRGRGKREENSKIS